MLILEYPRVRPRRLRKIKVIRDLVAEARISIKDLIMPIFVTEGIQKPQEIRSMPGIYRYDLNSLIRFISNSLNYGIKAFLLFGIPRSKDDIGSETLRRDSVTYKAISTIKREFGEEVIIFADLCLCGYTSHAHCGLVRTAKRGSREYMVIDNDETLRIYGKIAVNYAEAGADFIAPSGMMDGMVLAIRNALDTAGFTDVGIMSYSVKYASNFYGPFREALNSAPRFGDRKSYQMDPRNAKEALKEILLDIVEGADILMVKPALAYLDIIRLVKDFVPYYPLAAYSVSGEYAMIKAASMKGWIDEKRVVLELVHSIKRAGADLIITYYAVDIAKWINEGYDPF